eukprot:TRINITY_DN23713_c0_g1_i1.p1 TRINITY_DN23713_c0_g1~~TRINITY_DN23713_c0_g1_i1.p1  ORF type:complete len:434 (-),score=93.38 TRINITY_DN23713_c0_g1_i1:64-1365(-)
MCSKGQSQNAEGQASETTRLLPSKLEDAVPEGHATGLQLTLNVVTCGLGTGIFTLPWSTAGASSLVAVVIVAGVLVLNAWTISILVKAAERHQVFDIGSLMSFLPGRLGSFVPPAVNVAIWLGTFFCLVSYIIVVADCAKPFMEPLLGPEGLHQKLAALASVLVLPLCLLDQQQLSVTSSLSMLAVGVILGLLAIIYATEQDAPKICQLGFSWGSVAMLSAMMQTVVIQVCVLPMYGEMKNRSPGHFDKVIMNSFGILFLICSSFALLGYHVFGGPVSSNVLLNLPHSNAGTIGRGCAAASVLAVYPIIMKPMLAALEPSGCSQTSLGSFAATAAIVAAVMVTACFVRDLGKVNIINGAASMGIFVAVVPFLVGRNLLGQVNTFRWSVVMYALLVLGILSSILGVCLVDNYASDLQAACLWILPGSTVPVLQK